MRIQWLSVFFIILLLLSTAQISSCQLPNLPNVNQQSVTYQKQSYFIHEFDVPLSNQRGLKGIVTDSQGNPWFYSQTEQDSVIMKLDIANNKFTSYPVSGKTVTDAPVINLAGGQMIFHEKRNSLWFTDARINAIGILDIKNNNISTIRIPTNNSGIMGIVLSPDNKTVWFTEIIGNKIGSLDIDSMRVTEYPTGDFTGPTLLTFDSKGQLWVTLSYSNSILKVEPWLLIPESRAGGITEIKLDEPDSFSPFGIAIIQNKMFISDHGSSRVIVSDLDSELTNYASYWTSPSPAYPASLPSQVVSDKYGTIYFPQHGGNRITKISASTGLVTEFDIPTGPLATVVYIAISPDASRVWFTEWASNKIAYLDANIPIPLELRIKDLRSVSLKVNQTHPINIQVSKTNIAANSLLHLNGIELSLIGMTDSGLQGLTYVAKPQRFNMNELPNVNGTLELTVDAKVAIAGKYTVMPRVSMLEKDNLTMSVLLPQLVSLDIPVQKAKMQNLRTTEADDQNNPIFILLRDLARYGSIGVALVLIGYLIYRKVSRHRKNSKNMK